jgi:hypothetical protein
VAQYRKKPVVIEAEQFFVADRDRRLPFHEQSIVRLGETGWYVETMEGPLHVSEGDWIIKGVKGEFYPCTAQSR